jgi:hypothetical protein
MAAPANDRGPSAANCSVPVRESHRANMRAASPSVRRRGGRVAGKLARERPPEPLRLRAPLNRLRWALAKSVIPRPPGAEQSVLAEEMGSYAEARSCLREWDRRTAQISRSDCWAERSVDRWSHIDLRVVVSATNGRSHTGYGSVWFGTRRAFP